MPILHRLNSHRAFALRILDAVVFLLFCVPALQPLMTESLTCGYDHTFHLWRSVQIESLWHQGVLYSRWAPAMAHGLGYPLYLFTSPFPPAFVALLHRLGITWAVAMNVVFAVGMVLGGFAMVKLARELFGYAAGWAAGIAYVYAPFQAYDVFNRGSLWEALAWAWPPLVLWGLHRWVKLRDRRALFVGVAAFVAMMMSHYLFAFLFAPLFVLWVGLLGAQMREPEAVGRGAVLGLFGLGVTAFFWLPPLIERTYVQTGRLLGTWVFDYQYNFLPLSHLLALPRRADPNLINDWPQKSLGLVPVLLGMIPLIFLHRFDRRKRASVGLLAFLTLLFAALTLEPSLFLWNRLSLLSYVQFPWRYLGPAAFCLSLLIGAATEMVISWLQEEHDIVSRSVPVLVVVVVVSANLGWFFPRHCPAPSDISVAAMIRWELATDTLGTTAKGEYLPIWAERLVETTSLLVDYEAGDPVVRLLADALPSDVVIHESVYQALGAEIRLSSTEPFTARYLALYYPGWKVFVDGVRVPITPERETGLITFPVPAGTHQVEIIFGETQLRWVANVVSMITLLGFVSLVIFLPRGQSITRQLPRLSPHLSAVAFLTGLGMIGLKLGVIDRQPWLWRASRLQPNGSLQDVERSMQVNFANRALLLGREGFEGKIPSGATREFTTYWRALNPGEADWHIGLSLVDADGDDWPLSQRPTRWGRTPPGLNTWPSDGYARMDNLVGLPAGIPPGVYTPTLSLFDRKTLEPASVLGRDGNPIGPSLSLTTIEVIRPTDPPTLSALGIPPRTELQMCDDLGLWWLEPDRTTVAPGEALSLRWVWEAIEPSDNALRVQVILEDAQHRTLQTWALPLTAAGWPTDRWQRGDRWVGRPTLRLSGSLESGRYLLKVQLPACDPLAELPLDVNAPERVWSVPESLNSADWVFGSRIRLAGYAIPDQSVISGTSLEIQLAWQALDEITTPYRVFLHLVDDTGRLVDQHDGEPVHWSRPTTGWAVGEVVVETRLLSLPESAHGDGSYHLLVGLYEPDGNRLRLPDGSDAVPLGEVRIP